MIFPAPLVRGRLTREVRYGRNRRIDLLLEAPERQICYVAVGNVHLSRGDGLAKFQDCDRFRTAAAFDPAYPAGLGWCARPGRLCRPQAA